MKVNVPKYDTGAVRSCHFYNCVKKIIYQVEYNSLLANISGKPFAKVDAETHLITKGFNMKAQILVLSLALVASSGAFAQTAAVMEREAGVETRGKTKMEERKETDSILKDGTTGDTISRKAKQSDEQTQATKEARDRYVKGLKENSKARAADFAKVSNGFKGTDAASQLSGRSAEAYNMLKAANNLNQIFNSGKVREQESMVTLAAVNPEGAATLAKSMQNTASLMSSHPVLKDLHRRAANVLIAEGGRAGGMSIIGENTLKNFAVAYSPKAEENLKVFWDRYESKVRNGAVPGELTQREAAIEVVAEFLKRPKTDSKVIELAEALLKGSCLFGKKA